MLCLVSFCSLSYQTTLFFIHDLENLENLELSGIFEKLQNSGNSQGISSGVREFSALGYYFLFVLIFCLLDQGDEDPRGNVPAEKWRYFDLDVLKNSPGKPGIKGFDSMK